MAIGARKKPSLAKGIAETLGVQELCIAVGAATYWSTTALLCIAWNGGHAAAGPASFLEQGLSHAAACAAIGVAFALSAKMLERRFQMGLLGVGIVSALCGLVAQVFAGQGAKAFSTIVLGVHSGCFIVFWGLNFIDLNKSEANKTVLLTGVLTMAFYACGQFFPEGLRTFGTALALRLLGVAPFLLGAYRLSLIRSSVDSGRWRFLAGFALNRVAFGLCNGCLVFVTTLVPLTIAGSSWVSASVLLVVLGAAATFSFSERGRKNTNGFLVVMPLVFACFFSCGPLLRHNSSFGPVALVVCWLSWIMLGSTEMSDVKERVGGGNEAKLAIFEKLVFMATSLVGYVASVLGLRLFWGGDVDAPLFIEETFPVLLMFGCVLLSCCVLSFVTNNKERNEMLEDMLLLERNGNEELYRRIADAYGLTNREREVLCLVARGYSRPAICKELFLAESTVRSHIKHVYAKLNVHSKDEAIFAVEQFKRNHVN